MPAEWQPARGQRAPGLSWGPAESQTLAPRKRVCPWARPEHAASASRSQESGHVDVPARVTSLAPQTAAPHAQIRPAAGGDLPDSWWRRCRAQVAVRGRHPVLAGAASGYGFSPLASSLSPAWPAGGCCLPFVGASPLPGDRGRPAPRPPLPTAGAANSAPFPGAVSSCPGTVASGGEKSLGGLTGRTVVGSPGPPHQPPRADVHSAGIGRMFREPAHCTEVSAGQVGRPGLRAPRPDLGGSPTGVEMAGAEALGRGPA